MTNTLNYICKACGQVQPAEASCTYRNQLGSTVTETAGVTTDVANDPTVGTSFEALVPRLLKLSRDPVVCSECEDELHVDECAEDVDATTQDTPGNGPDGPIPSSEESNLTQAQARRMFRFITKARAELPGRVAGKILAIKNDVSSMRSEMSHLVTKTSGMSGWAYNKSRTGTEDPEWENKTRQLRDDATDFDNRLAGLRSRVQFPEKGSTCSDNTTISLASAHLKDEILKLTYESDVLGLAIDCLCTRTKS